MRYIYIYIHIHTSISLSLYIYIYIYIYRSLCVAPDLVAAGPLRCQGLQVLHDDLGHRAVETFSTFSFFCVSIISSEFLFSLCCLFL